FAGTFNDGLYGSDNDGESWQRLGEDALHERVMSIAVSRTEQLGEFRVIWAGTEPKSARGPGHHRDQRRERLRCRTVHHVYRRYGHDEPVLTAADEFYRRTIDGVDRVLPVVYRRAVQQHYVHSDLY